MIVREALTSGAAQLKTAGVETPGLDASLLLAEVLGISRSSLTTAGPDPLTETSFSAFDAFIKRRLAGECIAYILGRKEFYGLEFLVNPSVLVPRPETELLVETVINLRIKNQPLRVLDLCTGSGAIAIALKHEMPEAEVWATDISAEALETAKANACRLLPPESIRFCQGDLFGALLSSFIISYSSVSFVPPCLSVNLFSVIVTNPPYVPTAEIAGLSPEVRAEPLLALDGGEDGLTLIEKIIAGAPKFLYPDGVLLLEADPRQMKKISCMFKENGFSDIQVYRDLSDNERVIGGRK